MVRRSGWVVAVLAGLLLATGPVHVGALADTLPARLTDAEFWALSSEMSEPDGYFRTDNLLSNELRYPAILPDLVQRVKPGGVYLGVGPEQNFHYIVALRPRMAFVTDVRRGNLHLHLMYKALFELSADRSEFVARLFTKPRQPLAPEATAVDLMNAYWDVDTSERPVFERNMADIRNHLTKSPHALPLPPDDLEGIENVYYAFYWFGPSITYNSSSNGRGGNSMANFAQLMVAADEGSVTRSFLGSEETFRFMKDLEQRNLIVPVVGNFGGPKALRAVGQYVRNRGAVVSAFYLSNVEQYLRQEWPLYERFCANVASMPLDEQSTFIRSQSGGGGFGFGGFVNSLGRMAAETQACAAAPVSGSAR
jgi:hypothetical protein